MNEPIRPPSRDVTSTDIKVPSCVGGWNTNDALSMMPITDAVVMDNFIAEEGYVALREGYTNAAPKAMPDIIKNVGEIGTLMSYDVKRVSNSAPERQTDSLIFVAKKEVGTPRIYKYRPNTADAPVPLTPENAPITINGYNSVLYRKTLIMTKAGNRPYWFIENTDGDEIIASEMIVKMGTIPAEIGEFHNTMLDKVALYRDRLFFSIKDELVLLCTKTAGAIPVLPPPPPPPPEPAVTWNIELGCIDISVFCTKGGSIAMITNWTKTGAESLGNLLVVITTMGEVLVFSGNNPTVMIPTPVPIPKEAWNFEGRFEIPKLIPNSNGVKMGGDFVVMTVAGYMGIGDMLNASFISTENAVSHKIDAAVKEVVEHYEDFKHWNLTYSVNKNMLIANVPSIKTTASVGQSHQHVLNLSTKAWSRFTGLNATCFGTFKDNIYFAKFGGGLYKMFDGSTDDGHNIKGYVQQAYSDFQSPKIKRFIKAGMIASDGLNGSYTLNFNVDFKSASTPSVVATTTASESMWDVAIWDVASWNLGGVPRIMTSLIQAFPGVFGSIGIRVDTNYRDIKWYSTILTLSVNK